MLSMSPRGSVETLWRRGVFHQRTRGKYEENTMRIRRNLPISWLVGRMYRAWGSHEGGFGVALGWLCTPESMPSICLQYGFVVASGGLSVQGSGFRVQGSTFGVRRSAPGRNLKHRKAACRPSAVSLAYIYEARPKLERPKVTPWESPMTARRLSHDSPVCLARSTNRFGLYNSGSRSEER